MSVLQDAAALPCGEIGPLRVALHARLADLAKAEAEAKEAVQRWEDDDTADLDDKGHPAYLAAVEAALIVDGAERRVAEAREALLASDEIVEYTLRDEQGCVKKVLSRYMADVRLAAEEWVRGGDYGDVQETIWVDCWISGEAGDEDKITVAIDPDPPRCVDGSEHDWRSPLGIVGGIAENPGVWGHGGGVTIAEVCMRCGAGKHTDTWAQRPGDGRQGLTSVEYRIGEYAEEARDE